MRIMVAGPYRHSYDDSEQWEANLRFMNEYVSNRLLTSVG